MIDFEEPAPGHIKTPKEHVQELHKREDCCKDGVYDQTYKVKANKNSNMNDPCKGLQHAPADNEPGLTKRRK